MRRNLSIHNSNKEGMEVVRNEVVFSFHFYWIVSLHILLVKQCLFQERNLMEDWRKRMYIFRFITCHQRGEKSIDTICGDPGIKTPSRSLWSRNGSQDEQMQTFLGVVPGALQSVPSGSLV